MTWKKVNPLACTTGKHGKRDSDAHVPPPSQAQGHTEIWSLPLCEGKNGEEPKPPDGSGGDTTLPSCLRSLELSPNERERLVTAGGELFPICLCSSEWRGSALHQNNPIE